MSLLIYALLLLMVIGKNMPTVKLVARYGREPDFYDMPTFDETKNVQGRPESYTLKNTENVVKYCKNRYA